MNLLSLLHRLVPVLMALKRALGVVSLLTALYDAVMRCAKPEAA